MTSWLNKKDNESPEEHKKRLGDLLEAITGTRALPLWLTIAKSKDPKRFPQYGTCSNLMMCPEYDSEEVFREKLEESLPNALLGFQRG
jgi:hypothetical protein